MMNPASPSDKQQAVLASASFDGKVLSYWVVLYCLISSATIMFIPLMPIVALLAYLIGRRVIKAMSAELLTRKLVVKRGILFKVEKSIPLEKITDVGMTQGPLMRAFGIYRLDFETAGQSGHGALVSMLGIIDAAGFREQILEQKDALAGTTLPSATAQTTTASSESVHVSQNTEIDEIKASLQRIEGLLEKIAAK